MTARAASIALSPLMIGIIISFFVCRPLLKKLGRLLMLAGLGLTLAGAAGLWATVLAQGTTVSLWALGPEVGPGGTALSGGGRSYGSFSPRILKIFGRNEPGRLSRRLSAAGEEVEDQQQGRHFPHFAPRGRHRPVAGR
jgi:hypothetical protein